MELVRVTEGHPFYAGSTICPHPSLADIRDGETYETYVDRHLTDHGIDHLDARGESLIRDFEDRERNLTMQCLFFYAKHIQGNASLGVGDAIVADWEPCWEDAEFLANDTFHPDDLEQNTPWAERVFRLKPFAERRKDGIRKKKKKLTKVRSTQKTSWVKAFITWKHLRAYFLFGNSTLRALVMSCNKPMARDNYFEPIKTMWMAHATLQRLFGTVEYTSKYPVLVARRNAGKPVSDEQLEAEKRYICLLSRGSRASVDRMRLRWNIADKDYTGMTAVSLCCSGAGTSTQGGRWDIIGIDDAVDRKNSRTPQQRKKLRETVAELRKQGGNAEIVYLNTPQNAGDVSDLIDREQGDEYHIMYRPAMWYDTATKEPRYYWQWDALGVEMWTPKKINAERKEPDFWSQIMLRLRDESTALFHEGDFILVEANNAPLEVRVGLGGVEISERDAAYMQRESLRVRGFTYIDTADETERANGDDSAVVSWRFDRFGDMYITQIAAGRWNTEQEMQQIFDAWQYNDSERVEFETSGAHEKWVRTSFADFQRRKATETRETITMPLAFENAAKSSMTKDERIDRMYSYTSTGRVHILSTVPKEMRDKLVSQYCHRGEEPHDDLADASSRVQTQAARAHRREKPKPVEAVQQPPIPRDGVRIKVKDVLAQIEAGQREPSNWGARRTA